LSRMTQDQVNTWCDVIMKHLKKTLQEQLATLNTAYEMLDGPAAADSTTSNEKHTMRVGNINDFHQGLAARIGKTSHLYWIIALESLLTAIVQRGTTSEFRESHGGGALQRRGV
jgi:hypothetical protein